MAAAGSAQRRSPAAHFHARNADNACGFTPRSDSAWSRDERSSLTNRLFVGAVGGAAAEIFSCAAINKEPANVGPMAGAVHIHLVCRPVAVEDDNVLRIVGRAWPQGTRTGVRGLTDEAVGLLAAEVLPG